MLAVAGEPYTLSGCAPIVCTTPTSTTGYSRTTVNLDLSKGAFDVRVSCAPGYGSNPAVAACTTSGPYTLSGCSEIVCTSPAGNTPEPTVGFGRETSISRKVVPKRSTKTECCACVLCRQGGVLRHGDAAQPGQRLHRLGLLRRGLPRLRCGHGLHR